MNAKENIKEVNMDEVLSKLEQLKIYEFNYKNVPDTRKCIGPFAQEWYALFPNDKDNFRIETGDIDGVTLAAIKGLKHKIEIMQQEHTIAITNLKQEIEIIKLQLSKISS